MSPFPTLSPDDLAAATGGKHKHARDTAAPAPAHHGPWSHRGQDPYGLATGIGGSAPGGTAGTDPIPTGRTASSYRGSFR
ncbi:MAG: hypothetical protein E6J90_24760 [Deltaproteobacteria bacterium]|nr:MAG: hypothetical protein E6J90_24760 [Deltaproteobacteria bacterium]